VQPITESYHSLRAPAQVAAVMSFRLVCDGIGY
jgi:hypothetical protein